MLEALVMLDILESLNFETKGQQFVATVGIMGRDGYGWERRQDPTGLVDIVGLQVPIASSSTICTEFSLKLVPSSILLLRLTTIYSSPGLLLVPGHARSKCYVYPWWRCKAEALRYLDEV